MDADAIWAFVEKTFPAAKSYGEIVSLGNERLVTELTTGERHLRPGGTVSGPVMMTMVDTAAYYLVLSLLGPVGLAVTTSLHIDFLRKPTPGTLRAEAELLKLGKRLAVVSVAISRGGERFAQASVTYSLPPR